MILTREAYERAAMLHKELWLWVAMSSRNAKRKWPGWEGLESDPLLCEARRRACCFGCCMAVSAVNTLVPDFSAESSGISSYCIVCPLAGWADSKRAMSDIGCGAIPGFLAYSSALYHDSDRLASSARRVANAEWPEYEIYVAQAKARLDAVVKNKCKGGSHAL